AQHTDPLARSREVLEHDLRLDFTRAVVDEEDFEAIGESRGKLIDRGERGRELIRRGVHGDHERQGGYRRRRSEHLCLVTSGGGAVSGGGPTVPAGAA